MDRPAFVDGDNIVSSITSVNNSTVAATLITNSQTTPLWIGNISVMNTHTAAVTIKILKDNIQFWAKSVPAIGTSGYISQPLVEKYGSNPEKQFCILENGSSLTLQTSTAVANDVIADCNGGNY